MKEPLSIGKRIKNIAPVRLIVISFALVILIGATLITLPISARDGQTTNFVDALFTATSATCVTGLVVVDTWTHFNGFGQAVILFLIQVEMCIRDSFIADRQCSSGQYTKRYRNCCNNTHRYCCR